MKHSTLAVSIRRFLIVTLLSFIAVAMLLTIVATASRNTRDAGRSGSSATTSPQLQAASVAAPKTRKAARLALDRGSALTLVQPPTINKAFGAATIPLNGSTSLTFTINNPNTTDQLTGVGLTVADNLPAGLVVATPGNLSNTCGGVATGSNGSSSVNLTGVTLAASATCTLTVQVTGTTAGVKPNSVQVTSIEGGNGNTSNTSTTVVQPPTIGKAFGAATIPLNGSTSMTFTINNPNTGVQLTGVGFTVADNLPAGLVVATPGNLSNTCGGVATGSNGSSSVNLTGVTLAASATCTSTIQVTGTTAGVKPNSVQVTSIEGGDGNTSNTSTIVVAPPTISKVFGSATTPLNGSTSMTFTINNPNSAVQLTGVGFTAADNLPAGLVVATPGNLTNTCGGTAAGSDGSTSVNLTGVTLAASATCTVTVQVTGTAAGVKPNSVQITSIEGGDGNTSNTSTTVVAPPTISKDFGAANIQLNGKTSLTFTVTNPNTANALSGVGFTDTLPGGLKLTSTTVTGTCGSGTITATINNPPATPSTVSLSGGTLTAASQCQFSVNVTGIAAGSHPNTTGAVTSTEGGTGTTSNTATLKVEGPPQIVKAFSPTIIAQNATTQLTFTITNPAANPDPLTGAAFTDNLPAGLTVANGTSSVCGGINNLTISGGNTISLTGTTIASQCLFSVTVTGATVNNYINTTSNVTSTNSGTGNQATANLRVITCLTSFTVDDNGDAEDASPGDGFCATSGGVCTLRAAIQEANAVSSCGDFAINFSVSTPNTITLNTALPFISHNISINGPGANLLTVQRSTAGGMPEFRIFGISGGTVKISGLTISNGIMRGAFGGGAIYNDRATLTLTNCVFSLNSAEAGGAIYNSGIFGTATVTITNVIFSQNSAMTGSDPNPGAGGAIFNIGYIGTATLTIANSTFSQNSVGALQPNDVGQGGAIFNFGTSSGTATLTITNSTFSQNSATSGFFQQGGAIFNYGLGGTGNAKIANSTFSQNSAHEGGGIFNDGNSGTTNLSVVNSTFSQNSASGEGGAILNDGLHGGTAILFLTNSTFKQNSAPLGGAIDNFFTSGNATTQIGNTILQKGASGENIRNVAGGTVTSLGNNLSDDAAGGDATPGPGGLLNQAGDQRNTDPLLGALGSNGGPTLTHLLLPGSPAINAGSNSLAVDQNSNPLTSDQRSAGFPRIVNSTVDIGAVEVSYGISATAGTPQSTAINTAFPIQLQATAAESVVNKSGINVTFTAPASGASGTFPSNTTTATVTTNGSGVATAPVFTANGLAGGPYNVVASLGTGLPTATFALTNNKGNQTITVNTHAPSSAAHNTSFTVAATSGSGLPVSFSSSGVCTNVGATFTMTSGTGTCTVKYDQAGDSNFNAAPQVTESVTAQKANQTITFGALSNKNFGAAPFTVSATASSGLPVSFQILSGPATISGNTITITGVGTVTVRATQAGDSNFNAATPVDQPFTVAKGNQTITVNTHAPSSAAHNTSFTVAATSSSGLPVSFSSSGVCTNVGATFTMTGGTGACTVKYDQAGNSNFNAAPQVTEPVTAQKANQAITFGALANKTFGAADFTISATSDAVPSLGVSFGAIGNCTVTGTGTGTVHITSAGSCTITASQAGNGNYNPATNVPQSFNIAKAATTTAVSSSNNPSGLSQSVTFTATVTSGGGTPTGTVQFKDNGTNLGAPQTLNGSGVAIFTTSALTASTHTITADYSGDVNFVASTGTLPGGQVVNNQSLISFSQSTYSVGESGGFLTITVNRSGDTTSAVTADYATSDGSASLVPCSTANGVASSRCDFTTALGTLKFAAGETSKTFVVLITQDSYIEGPETFAVTLSNPTGGAVFISPSTATVTIVDDATEPSTNPNDGASDFVRQHYHDFLNREPDASGLAFWINEITSCGTDAQCIGVKRVNVSAAFYLSIEFQDTGYLVERMYKTSYGDAIGTSTVGGSHQLPVPIVRLNEFLSDTQEIGQGVVVGQGNWQQILENNKQAFASEFVQRARFTAAFPISMTPAQFVDTLNANAGNPLSPSERNQLVSDLTSNARTRAQVLRAVAEDPDLVSAEFNRAFVLMQFLGYLRRNPNDPQDTDYSGYDFWLTKLNQFNGNFQNAEMVKAFITSVEYRQRFGP